jgi:hypothetical protein
MTVYDKTKKKLEIFWKYFLRQAEVAYIFFARSLKLLLTTLTELSAIAAPAIIGLRRKPKSGYNAPAATGIPIRL